MYRFALTGILCAALLGACDQQVGNPRPNIVFNTIDYQCENGAQLQVKYANPEQGPSMATLTYQNKLVPMHQERAASGVLYVADRGHPGYHWHSKGSEGVLLLYPNGGDEQVVLRDCRRAEAGSEAGL